MKNSIMSFYANSTFSKLFETPINLYFFCNKTPKQIIIIKRKGAFESIETGFKNIFSLPSN